MARQLYQQGIGSLTESELRTIAHAGSDALDLLQKQCHKDIIYLILHDEPCSRHTSLSRCDETSKGGPIHSGLDVCVVEDYNWSLQMSHGAVSEQVVSIRFMTPTLPPSSAV